VDRKKEITDAPPLRGTVVEVRDLFFNTPARRKFLKSISTELSHIIETVIQKAFAYPNIAFSLTHNSSEVLNAPPAVDLRERFVQLYGEEFTDEFLEVRREDREIKIRGFSSKENFLRTNRSYQNIFVNRRPVKNSTISHAVYSAYEGLLPKERHPAYFLFLDIDPARVDVNVHPAKREVRFESPDRIHDIVKSAIRQTLGRTEEGRKHEYRTVPPPGFNLQDTPVNYGYGSDMLSDSQAELFTLEEALSISSFFHIGEAFIAMVTDNGLLLIDQHAAHERILYDRFLRGIDIETEAFFLPVRVELPVREYNILIKHRALLHDTGVEIEEFGANSLVIRAVPKELKGADLKGLLMDIAAGIIEEETSGIKDATGRQGLLRSIAQRLACHRAVRGAEHLSSAELRRMLSDLDKTEEPDRCPHGRPTRILISMNDLKRMFKRR
jgi:DNA mismatch repair protein MutL